MRVPHRKVEAPLLIGRSLCDARREAARVRLRVAVSPRSPGWWAERSDALRVVGQDPRPHAPIRRRCSVSVVVDGGPVTEHHSQLLGPDRCCRWRPIRRSGREIPEMTLQPFMQSESAEATSARLPRNARRSERSSPW